MKKEIMALVNSKDGSMRLNDISSLHRWTETGTGASCDKLAICFDTMSAQTSYDVFIESRDYDGIISEVEAATIEFFNKSAKETVKRLKAGYWLGKDKDSWLNIKED